MDNQRYVASEVTATCSSIGKLDENDGTYMKDRDCIPCLKELMRFLRNDTTNVMIVRHTLGALNVIKTDLIPLFVQYCPKDDELFELVVKICVNLTTPVQLLFTSKLEVDAEDFTRRSDYQKLLAYLYTYKEAFANSVAVWSVLVQRLRRYLKLDFDSRTEDDNLLFERIIILIRNVLHIPVDVNQDSGTHELCLYRMHQHEILDLIHEINLSEHGDDFLLHIIEIIMIMLRDFDPEALAKSSVSQSSKRKRSDHDRESDKRRLAELIANDRCQKSVDKHRFIPQRFKGSAYQMKNTTVEYVVRKPTTFDVKLVDQSKKPIIAPRHRRPIVNTATSNINAGSCSIFDIRGAMKNFCVKFVENEYNQTMFTIKNILVRNQSQENDETYYSWAFYFFSAFNRHMNMPMDNISETISIDSLHYLQILISSYQDALKQEKKRYADISQRLHYAFKAYKELLNNLAIINESATLSSIGDAIKKSMLCEQDYRMLLLETFHVFDDLKYSNSLLIDLVEANCTFLDMIERYCADKKDLLISEKIKKRKARAKARKKAKVVQPSSEEKALIWAELSVPIIDALEGRKDLPTVETDPRVKPYYPASDKTLEDQKILVVKKLNKLMLDKEAVLAVALYRNARQVWLDDEEKPFGDFDITIEEELTSLQDIFMAPLEIDPEELSGPLLTPPEKSDSLLEEEHDNNEEDSDDNNDDTRLRTKQTEFDFTSFVIRHYNPNVVKLHTRLFSNFASNSETTNRAILKLFQRFIIDCGNMALFFNVRVFKCYLDLCDYKKVNGVRVSETIDGFIEVTKYLMAQFGKIANEKRSLLVEPIFWSTIEEANEVDVLMI